MAETGTIKNDNPVILGREIDQTAGFKVLDHAPIAVEQNHRVACAALDIMQPDAVDLQKATGRRIVALGFLRKISIGQGHRSQSSNHRRGRSHEGSCMVAGRTRTDRRSRLMETAVIGDPPSACTKSG